MLIPAGTRHLLQLALEEDIGHSDITTTFLVPAGQESTALIIAKGNFIVAGLPFAEEVFRIIDSSVEFKINFPDGCRVRKRDIIAEVHGSTASVLACERVSLNILQRLSGIATLTNAFAEKISGTGAKVVDTRKTAPGNRFMEKYAVRAGGGSNHRFGLYDGILIKDNHIEAAGSISNAIKAARRSHHLSKIEVEIENLNDLREALKAGADVVMLDNMTIEDMKEAVRIARGKAILEASGNITLNNIATVAETGVELISVGTITHSAPATDISMKIIGSNMPEPTEN